MIDGTFYEFDEMRKMYLYDPNAKDWIYEDETGKIYTIEDFIEYFSAEIERKSAENRIKSAPQKALQRGHRKKMFNNKDIEEIRKLKEENTSNRQIAKILKCDEKTIRNYLREITKI